MIWLAISLTAALIAMAGEPPAEDRQFFDDRDRAHPNGTLH
jgi:hypothetical protein